MHLVVLIYSRVSNADEINSSVNQEQICKDYLHSISERNNFTYEIYDVFIEEPGLSGGEYYNRPLYVKMLELMNNNVINAICVKESSRLDRNTEHSEKLRRLAKKKNILLLSRDLDYDIHSPSGQFFYTINSAKNEYEKNVTGERTRLAIRNDMRKGKIHAHSIPLGFMRHPTESGRWLPIPEEISLVNLIFEIFNRTISYSFTANQINEMGYKTKKGSQFTADLIKRIIFNKKYIAELKIPDEELIVSLPFGEQVNRKVFEQAQVNANKILENKNSNRKSNRTTLLVNLLYTEAGNKFVSVASGKDSSNYSYYRVRSEDITIPSEKIEQLILNSIKEIKKQDELKKYSSKVKFHETQRAREIKSKIQTSQTFLSKLSKEKNEVFNLLLVPEARSVTLVKTAEDKIVDLNNQIDTFNKTLSQLKQELELIIQEGQATNEALRSLDDEIESILNGNNRILQRKLIRSLIKKITIDMRSMIIKIFWQIKSTPEEIIIFDDAQLPPIVRYDEIRFLLLGTTPEDVSTTPLYHYYVNEKYATTNLAKKFGVSRTTVLKYLSKLNIKRNKVGSNLNRKRGVDYGKNISKQKTTNNQIELARIEKARELRKEGMSFHKIAKLFNELKIPTKHKKRWHGRSIQEILKSKTKAQKEKKGEAIYQETDEAIS